jgi:hypothetical protein
MVLVNPQTYPAPKVRREGPRRIRAQQVCGHALSRLSLREHGYALRDHAKASVNARVRSRVQVGAWTLRRSLRTAANFP